MINFELENDLFIFEKITLILILFTRNLKRTSKEENY